MVTLRIDHKTVRVKPGTTILEAARKAGLRIPTLCYLKGINEIGACRVCVVELKGSEKLVTACNTVVQEGMEIYTASARVRHARRVAVELMLTQHNCNCPTCNRNGNCKLQTLANALGVRDVRLKKETPSGRLDTSSPSIVRDPTKCILCYRCVSFCDKVQSLGIWRIAGTGARTSVEPPYGKRLSETECTYCGQCVTHCPVGALSEKSDKDRAWEAISDPEKVTIVQVAPAVRAAWGEALGLSRDVATPKRLVATLHHLGFKYVFDTSFAADLTIMEEASELLHRIAEPRSRQGGLNLPMFTSCCPAWIRFARSQYPEMVEQLSSAKSPQQMFGAVMKSYYPEQLKIPRDKLVVVSIMPCTAKKYEAGLPVMKYDGSVPDVDIVLTTRELCAMIREEGVRPELLAEEEFDMPFGTASGAGVIFGASGGVMEAALRSAFYLMTGRNPDPESFGEVRGQHGWKEATFELPGRTLRVAVVSGLANARELIEAVKQGRERYDFVEVMACPGGCAGGGGQPISEDDQELAGERSKRLYSIDKNAGIRFSHENPIVKKLYEEYLGSPGSEIAHKLLHTDHFQWEVAIQSGPKAQASRAARAAGAPD